jgi:hypothetical protein
LIQQTNIQIPEDANIDKYRYSLCTKSQKNYPQRVAQGAVVYQENCRTKWLAPINFEGKKVLYMLELLE